MSSNKRNFIITGFDGMLDGINNNWIVLTFLVVKGKENQPVSLMFLLSMLLRSISVLLPLNV